MDFAELAPPILPQARAATAARQVGPAEPATVSDIWQLKCPWPLSFALVLHSKGGRARGGGGLGQLLAAAPVGCGGGGGVRV